MYSDNSIGELEVMLQNLNEEYAHCPFRFHKDVFDDYCDILTREAHNFKGECPNQNYDNVLTKKGTKFPKCNYFQNKINIDYTIYKMKRDEKLKPKL